MGNVKMRGRGGQGENTAKALPLGKYFGHVAQKVVSQEYNIAIANNRAERARLKEENRLKKEESQRQEYEAWEAKTKDIVASRKFTDEQVSSFKRAAYARGKKSYATVAQELGIKKHELVLIMTGRKYAWVK